MSTLDRTLAHAIIPFGKPVPYRGKGLGECYQNVLVMCDFDMIFIFVWDGWEGVAHDPRVLNEIITIQQTTSYFSQLVSSLYPFNRSSSSK